MLEVVGLDETSERIYLELVGHPDATADELSGLCGIPTARSASSLRTLVGIGLARRLPGNRRFAATPPMVALSDLVKAQEEALAAVRHASVTLSDRFRSAIRTEAASEPVEVIFGREAIAREFDVVREEAREQLCFFERPPYVVTDPSGRDETEQKLLEQGVTYRVICDREALEQHGLDDVRANLHLPNMQVRLVDKLATKLVIADRRLAIIAVDVEVADPVYLVHQSSLLDALVTLFEFQWQAATPLRLTQHGIEEAAHSDRLSTDEATIVDLLAAGFTDATISRMLGCSERTVQRRIARIMRRLNAFTRFQLGVEAARGSWLDQGSPPPTDPPPPDSA